MKGVVIVSVLGLLLGSGLVSVRAEIDGIEQIINAANSTVSISGYTDCLLDRGYCSSKALEIKNKLPVLITSYCRGCSPSERKQICRLLIVLREKRPELWDEMMEKYDPKHVHRKNLTRFDQVCRSILRTRPRTSNSDDEPEN